MKKRPLTWISIIMLVVLLSALSVAALNSGWQYREVHTEAIRYDDEALIAAIRANMERANLVALMYAIVSVLLAFPAWYVACAFVIIRRMRAVEIPRVAVRCCIPLLALMGGAWWAHLFLASRPAEYHYDQYTDCLLAASGAACCGGLLSVISLYCCCHLPWRKRITK